MRIVVITGSRAWRDAGAIYKAVQGADLVMQGGALGADLLAEDAAHHLQIDTLVMRAKWSGKGKGAGPERNERMARKARELIDAGHDVECFAFPLSGSVGTWDCVDRMRNHGVRVTVHGEQQQRAQRVVK